MEPADEDVQKLRKRFNEESLAEGRDFHPKDVERANSDDTWLKRFLIHNDMELEDALTMMLDTCKWRKTNHVNDLSVSNVNFEYLAAGSMFIHNRDKDDKPLFIFKCCKHVKGQKDFEELKKCVIYWFERAERTSDQITLFFDMTNSTLNNLDMEYTKYLINLCKMYYPNFLNYILVFEMPWVLNAAFKIIKSWLPTKAVQKIKFVSRSSLKEYVEASQSLKAWGGTDGYQFVFTPEPAPAEWVKDENKKKVHFANHQMFEVHEMSSSDHSSRDDSIGGNTRVRLNPNYAITFVQEGIEVSGSFTITNTSDGPITFKVKTTSPEKFRVRPYNGSLAVGKSASVNVLLLSGYTAASIVQDKFLVLTLPLHTDNPSAGHTDDVWKSADKHDVEEHKLKCSIGSNVSQPSMQPNGAIGSTIASSDMEQKISQILVSLNHVSEICSQVEADLKSWRKLVLIFMIVFVSFAITILYALSNIPTDSVLPDTTGRSDL